MSLYLQPSKNSKEEYVLPKISEESGKKYKGENVVNLTEPIQNDYERPIVYRQQTSKKLVNESSQTIEYRS